MAQSEQIVDVNDGHRTRRRAGRSIAAWLSFAWCVTLLMGQPLHAERADRGKPTQIDANSQRLDDIKQTSVFTGNVVLTKGTLRVTGDRLEYREDAEGYQYAVVTVAPGKLATFRQRRDGTRPDIEEIVEGVAERIEYDGKTETARLFSRAQVKRLENGQPRDEISGARIVYDARNSTYDASGGADTADAGRVRTIIAPSRTDAEVPTAGTDLQPSRPAPSDGKVESKVDDKPAPKTSAKGAPKKP